MSIVGNILQKWANTLPHRTITGPDGSPYLTRYYLWPRHPRTTEDSEEDGGDQPFAVFLHFFHRSDADEDQHNHPWDMSVALVLDGGYVEERGDAKTVHGPGSVNVIRGEDFHRVDLLDPSGSWSLFVAGQKTGSWGFRKKETGDFIPWRDYISMRK